MAQGSSTVLKDRELSRLAEIFPAQEYIRVAEYFGLQRTTAMNIAHNMRDHAHNTITEYLHRWRNKYQDGTVEVREILLNILDNISLETGWFMPGQYEFLKLISHSTRAVSGRSSRTSGSSGISSISASSGSSSAANARPVLYRPPTGQSALPSPVTYQYSAMVTPVSNPHGLQVAPKKNQDHILLNKVAGHIVNWDEIRTLGLELGCDPNEIERLKSENISVKGAAYKILASFYESVCRPDSAMWNQVRNALKELEKEKAVVELGLDRLSNNISSTTTGSGACAMELSTVSRSQNSQSAVSVGDLKKFVISNQLRRKFTGCEKVTTVDDLKAQMAKLVLSEAFHPKGIPILTGPKPLALDDENFDQDYKWLNLYQMKRVTTNESRRNKPVVVAALDTGIYTAHPYLQQSVVESKNFVSDRPDQALCSCSEFDLTQDYVNHGTMVAGIIAKYGPVNLHILNYKVLPTAITRSGNEITNVESPPGSLDDILQALNYISTLDGTDRQVDIINMSFGTESTKPDLSDKLAELSKNKILIAAAGNDGARKASSVQWPAKHDNVICVGAHDSNGRQLGLSAQGHVDFLCPGQNVRSTAGKLISGDINDPGYFATNGTSFAAPHATAIAANIIATAGDDLRSQVTNTQVMRSILTKMGSTYPVSKRDVGSGPLKPAGYFEKENFRSELRQICQDATEGKL